MIMNCRILMIIIIIIINSCFVFKWRRPIPVYGSSRNGYINKIKKESGTAGIFYRVISYAC